MTTANNNDNIDDTTANAMEIWPVDLSKECQWKRLDRSGPWREYADAAAATARSSSDGVGSDNDSANDDGSGTGDDGTLGCCYASRVRKFMPTDVIAVDWHGMLAWEAIRSTLSRDDDLEPDVIGGGGGKEGFWQPCRANVCYFNFRVYSSSIWDHPPTTSQQEQEQQQPSNNEAVVELNDDNDDHDGIFYKEKEQLACRLANVVICLSEHDKCMLRRLMLEDGNDDIDDLNESMERKMKRIHILHPPLRGDIRELALLPIINNIDSNETDVEHYWNCHLPPEAKLAIEKVSSSTSSSSPPPPSSLPSSSPSSSSLTEGYIKQRIFITCMARLSPEKSPHNFISLLHKLGGAEFLRRHSLIPIVCGARSVEEYAKKVVDDFESMFVSTNDGRSVGGGGDGDGDGEDGEEEAWPYVVIDRHLGPLELSAVFSRTAVNVHPCMYDAYGMTLVESAAFGAPSIVNGGGKVGATSLLGEGKGCFAVDLGKVVSDRISNGYSGGIDEDEAAPIIDSIQSLLFTTGGTSSSDGSETVEDASTLRQIANEGRCRALGWDEMACCQGLIDILDELP